MANKLKYLTLYALILAGLCAATYGAEFYFNKGHAANNGPFFYAWYGFASCIGIVLIARLLGIFIKRNETYYEEK